MKAVKIESSDVVVALFPDATEITITDRGYVAGNQQSIAFKGVPLVVETGVTEPAKFVPGAQSHVDGVWSVVDQEKYDYDPAIDALNKAKAEKAQQIINDFAAGAAALVAGYTQEERDSFAKQEQQALTFNANPDETRTDLVMLKNMATQRSKTMQQVADRILLKAAAFEDAFGDLLGAKQAREDALNALGNDATPADVEAI